MSFLWGNGKQELIYRDHKPEGSNLLEIVHTKNSHNGEVTQQLFGKH